MSLSKVLFLDSFYNLLAYLNVVSILGSVKGKRKIIPSHTGHRSGPKSLNFRDFFLWCFQIARFFFYFYQKHMAFWPLTSSFSVERDFNCKLQSIISTNYAYTYKTDLMYDFSLQALGTHCRTHLNVENPWKGARTKVLFDS